VPFADWRELRTKMIWSGGSLILLGLGYLVYPIGWGLYWEVYTPITGIKDSLATHIETSESAFQTVADALEKIGDLLGNIEQNQQEDLKRDLTMRGLGTGGTFGGGAAYVRINADSDASLYKDGDKVKITVITSTSLEGRASEVFDVRGEWTHTDRNVLVSFSKVACDILEVEGIVKVQLEPVLEDIQ